MNIHGEVRYESRRLCSALKLSAEQSAAFVDMFKAKAGAVVEHEGRIWISAAAVQDLIAPTYSQRKALGAAYNTART